MPTVTHLLRRTLLGLLLALLTAASAMHESPSQTDTAASASGAAPALAPPNQALLEALAQGHELARRACLANAPCASNIDHYASYLPPPHDASSSPSFKGPRLIWISPSQPSLARDAPLWTYYLMPISRFALQSPDELLARTLEAYEPAVQPRAYGTAAGVKSVRAQVAVAALVGQRPAPVVYGVGVVAMFHEFAIAASHVELDASLYAQNNPGYREWALGVLELLRSKSLAQIPFEFRPLGGVLQEVDGGS